MSVLRIGFIGMLVVAGGALAVGYALEAGILGAVFAPLVAAAWGIGYTRGWAWTSHLALVLLFVSAMLSQLRSIIPIFESVMPFWPVISMTAAAIAWSIANFENDLRNGGEVRERAALESKFMQRLLIIGITAAGLGIAAVQIRVQFGFGIALLLGLISMLGLSRAVAYLRRESD